jgi:L-serine/L-threonine ammonia-lyase
MPFKDRRIMFKKTPLIFSKKISEQLQTKVYLKLENLQESGSFKDRGISNLCQWAYGQGHRSFVASSGGNAGLSMAWAANTLQAPATVVIPKTTPDFMFKRISSYNAKVIVHGNIWDEAEQKAQEIAKEKQRFYIPPFDHPIIWQGYESIVEETLNSLDSPPDLWIVSIGGGGLFTGIMQGLDKHNLLKTSKILAVEPQGAPSFYTSCKYGKNLEQVTTKATSLATKRVTTEAVKWKKKGSVIHHLVSDQDAMSACVKFANDHRMLVELACSMSLATLYNDYGLSLNQYEKICIVVCGGNLINSKILSTYLEKK